MNCNNSKPEGLERGVVNQPLKYNFLHIFIDGRAVVTILGVAQVRENILERTTCRIEHTASKLAGKYYQPSEKRDLTGTAADNERKQD